MFKPNFTKWDNKDYFIYLFEYHKKKKKKILPQLK